MRPPRDNEAFQTYLTWTGFLILKVFLLALYTGGLRFKNNAYENGEDLTVGRIGAQIRKDPQVERVRRAHQNDIENVLIFIIVAFFYLYTNPDTEVASYLIRVAVISRFFHTIFYAIYPVRQPVRFLCFAVMLGITIYMVIAIMVEFFRF